MKLLLLSVSILLLLTFCLSQMGNGIPNNVIAVLSKSGKNKNELLKVINHYKKQGDKQKLKAAYYLIGNMANRYHFEGPGLDKSRKLFAIMDSLGQHGHKDLGHAWDSLEMLNPISQLGTVDTVRDVSIIKADMLIRHIDAAFVAWHYPWARKLSLPDFYEYLLPYKLVNEEPECWNSRIQASFKWLLDSADEFSDARSVCILMNKQLLKDFYIGSFNSLCDINYTDLSMLKTGTCYHATQLSAYCMRAMGIPVVLDFTPYWANKNGGHSWNALLEGNKPLPFIGTESDPGKTKVEFAFYRKRAKIFRYMYSLQKKSLAMYVKDENKIPINFRSPYIADVTAQYEPVADVTIHLNGKVPDAKYAYLCVYNRRQWRPVYWGAIGADGQAVFKDMGKNIAYAPMYYRNNKFIAAGPAFILNKLGIPETCTPDTSKKTAVTIYKKGLTGARIEKDKEYRLFYWNNKWKLLAVHCATTDSIVCKNVPENALLIVSNNDQPDQDRIFTCKKGKQVWW